MPSSPKFKVGIVPYSNLRQALQWIKDGIRPVEPAYEPALGIDNWRNWSPSSAPDWNYKKEKSEIYLTICATAIPLFGRPGTGAPMSEELHDSSFWFNRYGDREPIPVLRLHEAGFDELDFLRSWIGKITDWNEHGWPEKGWGYSDLVILTADLMRVFPEEEDPFAPIIELGYENAATLPTARLPAQKILFLKDVTDRIAEHTGADLWDAAMSLHRALCSGELSAESDRGEMIPCGLWRSARPRDLDDRTEYWEFEGLRYSNPTLTTEAVDRWLVDGTPSDAQPPADQPAAEGSAAVGFGFREFSARSQCDADLLPVYLQFLVEMVPLLGGCARIAGLKKEEVEAAIRAQWRPELRLPSQNKVRMMAMILRPPEAQDGGAKPMRAAVNGASGEGWNRLTFRRRNLRY